MNARAHGLAYLKNEPFVICEPTLAAILAQDGWNRLTKETGINTDTYSIANCLSNFRPTACNQKQLSVAGVEKIIVEIPDFQRLQSFYDEHGLDPLSATELESKHVVDKLLQALSLLQRVKPVAASIGKLVKTLQVLRQDDAEIDTSYSHPKIPFSIFVSVCEDASLLSSLRVAESILHEAMHLQLTLLENVIELIRPKSNNLYYSPWRDEDRPARGILHGIYVFKAVHDFYVAFATAHNCSNEVKEFLVDRIERTGSELDSLNNFDQISDLTKEGKSLVVNLLEYHIDSNNLNTDVNNQLLLLKTEQQASDSRQ
ncbi:aKG-HExxH-type peptide beta-hydroxylase [Spirosoma arcticum]